MCTFYIFRRRLFVFLLFTGWNCVTHTVCVVVVTVHFIIYCCTTFVIETFVIDCLVLTVHKHLEELSLFLNNVSSRHFILTSFSMSSANRWQSCLWCEVNFTSTVDKVGITLLCLCVDVCCFRVLVVRALTCMTSCCRSFATAQTCNSQHTSICVKMVLTCGWPRCRVHPASLRLCLISTQTCRLCLVGALHRCPVLLTANWVNGSWC